MQINKLLSIPHAIYKSELKWTSDLNVKHKTITLLEKKNHKRNRYDLELGKDFLGTTPKAWPRKEIRDK